MTKLALKDVEVRKPHDWTRHYGGRCPCLPSHEVLIRYRNGEEVGPVLASSSRWETWRPHQVPALKSGETAYDIVAFRIVGGGYQ